jgi:Rrf2 family transcriptional regulator, iron-sulfur cluster assembly transcription factor
MLSTTSQYALRALCHLAAQSGEIVLGRELAEAAEIPANYLSKILLSLRNAGLVATARGARGGYRLGQTAGKIHLIDVVELFDEISRTKPRCFLGRTRECSEATPCSAHSAWRSLETEYVKFLTSTSLAQIAGKKDGVWRSSGGTGTEQARQQQIHSAFS